MEEDGIKNLLQICGHIFKVQSCMGSMYPRVKRDILFRNEWKKEIGYKLKEQIKWGFKVLFR